jgi:hypothetical protein
MPGLGGRKWTERQADDSASALVEIRPDFVRLRTTAVIPFTPLARLEEEGEFEPLTEVETVAEIRRFLTALRGLDSRIESDHMLNLLMELRGDLPRELDRLIGICDRFLDAAERDQRRFILARRMNLVTHLGDRRLAGLRGELDRILATVDESEGAMDRLFHDLRKRMV